MTEKNISESPFLAVQLFKGALTYLEAINMSVTASYGQIKVLDNEISMKVDNNGVIAAINLYSQTDGSGSGVKISGNKIDLEGQVTFSSLASSGAGAIKSVFTTQGDTTVINGAMIKTGSIKANDLLIKGNLSIINNENKKTFSVDADGNVEVDGLLQSSNFDEHLALGYQISPAGTAILNQAVVKGDVILPSSGMTNYGGQIGNENIALDTNKGTTGWGWGLQAGGRTITEVVEDGIRCCKITRDSVASTGWSYISYSRIGREKYLPSKKYTISFEVKSSVVTKFTCSLMEGNATNGLTTNSATAQVPKANTWTKLSFTLTTKDTLPTSTTQCVYLNGMSSEPGVSYMFRNLKIEEGTESTPWCPNKSEQFNNVRI